MKRQEPDPEKLSAHSLHEAALRYLERYDASVAQLRRVLLRRVRRYANAETEAQAREEIEGLLQRLCQSRLIDDARFAEGFTRGQRLRGGSARKVRQKLRQRGIDDQLVDQALGALDDEGLGDLQAARAYARRRRLVDKARSGDEKARDKALASLARQGFSFDVARRALDEDDDE